MGEIISIVYQPEATDVTHGEFYRVPVDEASLLAGHGIEGDRKAGRNPKRHLNIMMRETLDDLAMCGYKTGAGAMGEQLQIRGVDIESLPSGTLLKLGDSAIIRLNKFRAGCVWLEQIQGRDCADLENRIGLMATVMESGIIRVGDPVEIIAIPELIDA
ncbi:MAG: MOSC domain-containing protein [Chloroflexota bacterium]